MAEISKNIYCLNIKMSDVPHLTPEDIEATLAGYPEWERVARHDGIPHMGSGRVYPFPRTEITVPWFLIPPEWKVAMGLDVGNSTDHKTAAAWFAEDPNSGVVYLYDEYYSGYKTVPEHVQSILQRGNVPCAFDYSGNASNGAVIQASVREVYENCGLSKMVNCVKTVDAGIMKIWQALAEGKLKIFETCKFWLSEYDTYHFNEGKIVKRADDLMDASRYGFYLFHDLKEPKFSCEVDYDEQEYLDDLESQWASLNNNRGRNDVCGY